MAFPLQHHGSDIAHTVTWHIHSDTAHPHRVTWHIHTVTWHIPRAHEGMFLPGLFEETAKRAALGRLQIPAALCARPALQGDSDPLGVQ